MTLYSKYLKRYKIPFFTAIICVAFEAICDLLGPTLMANIINLGIEGGSLSNVYYWGTLMLIVTAFGACFAITRNILASKVSQRVGADLRYDLFEKILYFAEEGADKIESGSLITRMTNDTSQIVQFINGIMRIFLKATITCIGSIILATILNFRLALIIYVVVAIVSILIVVSMKFSYPRFYKLQKSMDKVNSVVQEYLIGIRLVKAFGTYDKEKEKFGKANDNLMETGISSQMIITLISPIITFTVGIGTVIVLFIGSKLFSLNLANPGDITAFTIYMSQILTSLIMITNIFNVFVRTKASTTRIKEIFQCEGDFNNSKDVFELNRKVEFRDVTFAYPNGSGVPAINNLSFSLKPGENLAIIGPTGSGKSTIAWLLLRFYDVNKGSILINEKLYESSNKAQIWSGYMMPLINVINNLIFTIVAIVGGILSVGYGLAVGTVVSFLSYSKQFARPLNSVAGMFNTIQSALAGAERVFEILDTLEEKKDDEDAIELKLPKGEVEFKDVSFSYDKSKSILNNINVREYLSNHQLKVYL